MEETITLKCMHELGNTFSVDITNAMLETLYLLSNSIFYPVTQLISLKLYLDSK